MNITILMPVWNRAATLRRAIESTAGQGADQFVIIDDHSTDGSYEIACEYPGITVHRHPAKSTDHLRALEPIIESLQTDYVLGIGADDYLYPGCIAALRRGHLHAQGENPGAIFADFDHVDSQAQLLRTVRYSPSWSTAARTRPGLPSLLGRANHQHHLHRHPRAVIRQPADEHAGH